MLTRLLVFLFSLALHSARAQIGRTPLSDATHYPRAD